MYVPRENSQEELVKFAESMFADALRIMKKKNSDYSDDDNPLKNFDMVEIIGVAQRDAAIYTRLMDKIVRIGNGIKRDGKFSVEDEKFNDSILDAINYLIILAYSLEVRNIGEDKKYKYISAGHADTETGYSGNETSDAGR